MRYIAILGVMLASGCATIGQERELRRELFDVQTRLVAMEGQFREKVEVGGDAANKRIASTSTEIEQMKRDVRKLAGDVDALRVGVQTGQMPGATDDGAPSLAQSIQDLDLRVAEVEKVQEEILSIIKKGGAAKTGTQLRTATASSNQPFSTLAAQRDSFQRSRFRQVADSSDALVKRLRGAEKQEALYYYAESLFKVGQLRDSALQFNAYVDTRPVDSKLRYAKLRLGDCFRHLGDSTTAKLFYNEVVTQFPDTEEATKAAEQLKALGG